MRTSTKAGLLAGTVTLLTGRARKSPDAKEPVRQSVDPAALPRPKLFAPPRPGEQPQAFRGLAEENSPPAPSKKPAWFAVGLMIVGVVLVGLFVATTEWPLLLAGLVVGAIGVLIAWKAQIMATVSVTDSPEGDG